MNNKKFKTKRDYQYQVIDTWFKRGKNLTKTELARKLGVSRPTLDSLLWKYENGEFWEFKRNYANNEIAQELKEQTYEWTKNLINEINKNRITFYSPTFTLLKPLCEYASTFSQRTFENILKNRNLFVPSCTRKTKSLIKMRIKEKGDRNEIVLFDQILDIEETPRRLYKKKEGIVGDIVEIDACQHEWIPGIKHHLYRAVDAASGYVLVEHNELEETSMGYLILLKKLLKEYGAPRLIVGDKRKTFWNGVDNGSQVSLMLNALDIEVFTSSEPTVKPNVERSFHDAQQLYPLLVFQYDIKDIVEFNKINDQFLKKHNTHFKKTINLNDSNFSWRDNKEIDEVMNLKIVRTVLNGNTLTINGIHYIPVLNNKRYIMEDNAKINVLSNDEYPMYIKYKKKNIPLVILEDKYEIAQTNSQWTKIEFEKRKNKSFHNMVLTKIQKANTTIALIKKYYPECKIDYI